jgi:hypothetical protein
MVMAPPAMAHITAAAIAITPPATIAHILNRTDVAGFERE